MVEFESYEGGCVFLDTRDIRSIHTSVHAGFGIVEYAGGRTYAVRGTPREVHAKLFPEAAAFGFTDTERNEAMLRVLTWVASPQRAEVPRYVVDDACNALAREGER